MQGFADGRIRRPGWRSRAGLWRGGGAVLAFVVCSLAALASVSAAQPADTDTLRALFQEANEAYQRKAFEKARDGYLKLIGRGVRDPVLYYNAGNAFVQLGENGRAVAMYERALRLAPRDADARRNLAYALPAGGAPKPFVLWRPFVYVRDRVSFNEWLVIFDALVVLVAIAWSIRLLSRVQWVRAVATRCLIAGIVLAVVVVGFLPWRWYVEYGRDVGVVIQDETVSHHGPTAGHGEHLRLAEGTRVEIIGEEANGWLCVRPLDVARKSRERTFVPGTAVEKI